VETRGRREEAKKNLGGDPEKGRGEVREEGYEPVLAKQNLLSSWKSNCSLSKSGPTKTVDGVRCPMERKRERERTETRERPIGHGKSKKKVALRVQKNVSGRGGGTKKETGRQRGGEGGIKERDRCGSERRTGGNTQGGTQKGGCGGGKRR